VADELPRAARKHRKYIRALNPAGGRMPQIRRRWSEQMIPLVLSDRSRARLRQGWRPLASDGGASISRAVMERVGRYGSGQQGRAYWLAGRWPSRATSAICGQEPAQRAPFVGSSRPAAPRASRDVALRIRPEDSRWSPDRYRLRPESELSTSWCLLRRERERPALPQSAPRLR